VSRSRQPKSLPKPPAEPKISKVFLWLMEPVVRVATEKIYEIMLERDAARAERDQAIAERDAALRRLERL
jgi:hypothetical protein